MGHHSWQTPAPAENAADALIDQHKAILSRVECLEQLVAPLTPEGGDLAAVVSALKQQSALTAEMSKSAGLMS